MDWVATLRFAHPWLLWLLPLGGVLIVSVYRRYGSLATHGNELIISEIHSPTRCVPLRMTPLILASTLITHLFGGSAGREGPAVEMGGSLADNIGRLFRVPVEYRPTLMMAGMAAGFGSIFGAPIAGGIFAIEVLSLGKLRSSALIPCLAASLLSNVVCQTWGNYTGVHHMGFYIARPQSLGEASFGYFTVPTMLRTLILGIACGGCARLFVECTLGVARIGARCFRSEWMRPVAASLVLIALTALLGTRSYLGLGEWNPIPGDYSLTTLFQEGGASPWSWWWKVLFTALTIGSGFKGGRVTPLFFMGAALGNALAEIVGLPVDLAAGIGFVAVFAGATNTPLACTLIGVELIGREYLSLFAIACFASWLASGHAGVYVTQRIGRRKHGDGPLGITLAEERERVARKRSEARNNRKRLFW